MSEREAKVYKSRRDANHRLWIEGPSITWFWADGHDTVQATEYEAIDALDAAYSQGYKSGRLEAEGLVAAARLALENLRSRELEYGYVQKETDALAAALEKWEAKESR